SVQRFALRLTADHDRTAFVTCPTLYVVFASGQSAVVLVNGRLTHFTATGCISASLASSADAGGLRLSMLDRRFGCFAAQPLHRITEMEPAPLLPKLRG